MSDQKKSFVHLLMLLLFLSFLVSRARPELMRASWEVEKAKYQVLRNNEMPKSNLVRANKRRFDIEINDYPGSGANSRHDPRNPGRP